MILLTGATGYVGSAFAAELRRRGLAFEPLSRRALDYTRFDVLFSFVRAARPSLIINAAGFTGGPDIAACETRRAETIRANTLLPQTLARVCYLTNTPLGHVSSGCIYSGARVIQPGNARIERNLTDPMVLALFDSAPECFHGFSERDVPNCSFRSHPCSFYSGSKALAEEALQWFDQAYLWRPRMLFDEADHPRNYLSWLSQSAGVCDSVDSLSHRSDFVRACLDLWQRNAPFGAYNIVNRGAIRTRRIAERLQSLDRPAPWFEAPEPDTEFCLFGRRPGQSHCILDDSKLRAAGIELPPVDEAIERSLRLWRPQTPATEWREEWQKVPVPN